jgi:hypothetical protein
VHFALIKGKRKSSSVRILMKIMYSIDVYYLLVHIGHFRASRFISLFLLVPSLLHIGSFFCFLGVAAGVCKTEALNRPITVQSHANRWAIVVVLSGD